MLTTLAVLLPMCYVYVASDASSPKAVLDHEMAHCWGWVHPEPASTPKFGSLKSSAPIPFKYRIKGSYPANRVEVYTYDHRMIAQECNGNPYGCAWGGLMPK